MSTRNLSNRILITLTPSEPNFIALQTYTPRHGRSRRFFMDKAAILSLLSGERSSLIDTDINSYLHLRFEGSAMSCKLVWLSVDPCDDVSGHVQRFRIPVSMLHKVLSGKQISHVARTDEMLTKAKLTFSSDAHAAIKRYAADKLTCRALSKFFRDYLNYGSYEHINIYADTFAGGFYICSPITGFNGGIILHKYTTRFYGFPKFHFSLHT